MVTAEAIVAKALEWVGLPYRADGRSRETGTDCTGLLVCILRELGKDPRDELGLGGRWDCFDAMCAAIERECRLVQEGVVDDPIRPADLMVFRSKLMPQHAGLCVAGGFIGELEMVHASQPLGRIVRCPVDLAWGRRMLRVYRYRGLA